MSSVPLDIYVLMFVLGDVYRIVIDCIVTIDNVTFL